MIKRRCSQLYCVVQIFMERSLNPSLSSSSSNSMKGLGSYSFRKQPNMEARREDAAASIVVMMDASKEIASSALFWAMGCLNLKDGDTLKLLRVVHDVHNDLRTEPNYRSEANMYLSEKMGWAYAKLVEEKEMEMKKEECLRNIQVELIRRECEHKHIQFDIEVRAGASTRAVALQAAREFKATWIILDRYIKKDAKFYMENLGCSISKVTRNNEIKILRGYISADAAKTGNGLFAEVRKRNSFKSDRLIKSRAPPDSNVFTTIYEETPVPVEEQPEDLFSLEISPVDQIKYIKDYCKQMLPLVADTTPQADSNQSPQSSADFLHFTGKGRNNEDVIPDTAEVKTVVENFLSNLISAEGSIAFPADSCSICQYRSSLVVGKELMKFTYAQIEEATDFFSEENCLSSNGCRPVYGGRLKQGLYIAVKEHKLAAYEQQEAEFMSQVEGISRAQHKNLVMLLGYCSEKHHRFLVYEYICKGSLHSHLYGSTTKILEWEQRRKIALGAARGLRYLHGECRGRQIIHGDLRLNKILLTHDLEPMLGDFGVAHGYWSPQHLEGEVSSDVYSLGVILLQLISGRKAFDLTLPPQQHSIVQWARPLIKEYKYVEILDRRIKYPEEYDELYAMIHAALLCLRQDPSERPSMNKVVHVLEGNTIVDINETPTIPNYIKPYRRSCSSIYHSRQSSASSTYDIKEVCDEKKTSSTTSTTNLGPLKKKKNENKGRRRSLSYVNMLT